MTKAGRLAMKTWRVTKADRLRSGSIVYADQARSPPSAPGGTNADQVCISPPASRGTKGPDPRQLPTKKKKPRGMPNHMRNSVKTA